MANYIKQPLALYETGPLIHTQDYIFPEEGTATITSRLFIVCDGKGGLKKGDDVAKFIANRFTKHIEEFPPMGMIYPEYLEQVLRDTEEEFTAYKQANPDLTGASASIGLVYIHQDQALFAWIGDVWIYHYQANSHTLVATSPTFMETSHDSISLPSIPAVITGKTEPAEMATKYIKLGDGDYILLCSSSIHQTIAEPELAQIFRGGPEPEFAIGKIKEILEHKFLDSYACHLIQSDIQPVFSTVAGTEAPASTYASSNTNAPMQEEKEKNSWVNSPVTLYVLGGLILLMIGFFTWPYISSGLGLNSSKDYDRHMLNALQAENAEDFGNAIILYDSAHYVAKKEGQRARAIEARNRTIREAIQKAELAYQQANPDYRMIWETLEAVYEGRNPEELPDNFPYDMLGISYIRDADEYNRTGSTRQQLEIASDLYEKGINLMEQKLRNPAPQIAEFIKASNDRWVELENKLGDFQQFADRGLNIDEISTGKRSPGEIGNGNSGGDSNINRGGDSNTTTSTADSEANLNGITLYNRGNYRESRTALVNAGDAISGKGSYYLGYMYYMGMGGPKNTKEAIRSLRTSIRKSNKAGAAHYLLGTILVNTGSSVDYNNGIKQLQKSANKYNHTDAIRKLIDLGVYPNSSVARRF